MVVAERGIRVSEVSQVWREQAEEGANLPWKTCEEGPVGRLGRWIR